MAQPTATNVLLAGGGSAGHVNPLLAVAAKLRAQNISVVALGTKLGLEKDLVPNAGIELLTIEKVPAPRRVNGDLVKFIPRILTAYKTTREYLKSRQIEAVIGFGGYVSAPAYLAARSLGIPVVIHEQNLRPGMANRLGADWAKSVFLTFAQTPLKAKHGQTQVVGLPLRPEIEQLAKDLQDPQERERLRAAAAAKLGLDPAKPTLLITGGSLGALKLNRVLAQTAHLFPADLQVMHLTGKGKSGEVLAALEAQPAACQWQVHEYFEDMTAVFAVADFAICRSGAGTVAELCALGIPALYVPLPIGNGEQKLNAAGHVEAGGALLIDDAQLSESVVTQQVLPLLASPDKLQQMRVQTLELAQVDAAKVVAQAVVELLDKN
ncbi:MAG: undecaprenyldiphospho-muramoylpentapeptide beta-N-acetylglucosaminyltransferase [Actinomycetaceae bacterium]|nr:undecaprenyldiphospho-muramoylpentapeptide beta-N-acetylglucosaminyltransferase [Actinomycetaceae bacterium]